MATLLLVVIYAAFIGLGVPDSLFGAAWPAIYSEFGLPVSYANFVTLTCSVCSLLSSMASTRVINKIGINKVCVICTALTAVSLFGISFADSFWFLILLAIPLGFGGGAVDAGLNNYVALHYNAMQMNFLHCFYGVGVTVSPYVLSFALAGDGGWRGGYRWIAFLQIGIFLLTLISAPLWNRSGHKNADEDEEEKPVSLSIREILRIKGLPMLWLMFFGACAIEVGCGTWGSTFLVEHKGMPVDMAAKIITFYYMGIAVGRFISGLLSVKLTSKQLVVIGEVIIGIALILLALSFGATVAAVGLFLTGLGTSPIYPNLMHLTPQFFGRSVSQSVMGTQMAAAYAGVMLAPVLFGVLADRAGAGLFPWFMMLMFIILAVSTFFSKIRQRGTAQ